ncbi:hypothetical protein B0T13DRAFT_313756 [Neurospora crassa]|nr:hypothetical protein B0T13DRAFT_313756 [Neurospora crassa]
MLSNFIITECFSSPWWVFKALRNTGNLEMGESPTVERISGQRTDEPAGFSVDVATWENISPSILSPGILVSTEMAEPATARSMTFMSPRLTNPRHVSMQSLGVITAVGVDGGVRSSVEVRRLPAEEELEGLFELLGEVQSLPASSPTLRASLLRILHEGGLSLDATHPSIAGNGARRMLAECRREYARKLKDRFLSGPARFLLRDQTPEGITKLEDALMTELDAALKFSSLVWARQNGDVHFKGLEELDMEGENIQIWEGADGKEAAHERPSSSASSTSHGGKPPSVMVVLQPAITCTTFSSSMSSDATAHCRSSSSASDRSSSEFKPELHTATTTISKALILLSNAFSPSSPGANSCPSTPSSTNSRPSTPQNRTSSSTPDCEEIMTPDTVVSLRLSMAACRGTPVDPTQKNLDSLETLPDMASKCGKRSPNLKLRSSPQLKLGGGGWTKEVAEGR